MTRGKTLTELAVGDVAQMTRKLNPELVTSFVTLSRDRNPSHRDARFAASTVFGECIAPGMLTAAMIAAACACAPSA